MDVDFKTNPPLASAELNCLLAVAWPDHGPFDDLPKVLSRSLGYICAYSGSELVGFVYVAWDGGPHAFLLDPVVRIDVRRKGIGAELVRRAAGLAKSKRAEWLHVDYEPRLADFYARCGFKPTQAGLMRLCDD